MIWEMVAKRYRGNPAVAAYDLLNEPYGAPSAEALWSSYDRIYRAIREVDPDHIITVEGCWSGKIDGKDVGWGWDALPPPSKFGWSNVVYQMHNYEWDWNNLDKQVASTDRQVLDFANHAAWGVPCWIGEFNPMAQPRAWDHAIRRYSAADMGWMTWTYKATHGGGDDSWGLYNPRDKWPDKPNIQLDSADTIRDKWSKWGTAEAFAINPMLKQALAMPVPVADAYKVARGGSLAVASPGVLANDTHANRGNPGIKLTSRKVSGPDHGTLTLAEGWLVHLHAQGRIPGHRHLPLSGFRRPGGLRPDRDGDD